MSIGNGGGEKPAELNLPFSLEIMQPLAEAAASILTVMHVVGVMDAINAMSKAMYETAEVRLHPSVLENAQRQALNHLWEISDKVEAARQAVRAL